MLKAMNFPSGILDPSVPVDFDRNPISLLWQDVHIPRRVSPLPTLCRTHLRERMLYSTSNMLNQQLCLGVKGIGKSRLRLDAEPGANRGGSSYGDCLPPTGP